MALGTIGGMIAASVVGGAASALGSRSAAKTQAKAANNAADAQLTATRETNDMLRDFRSEDVSRFDPFYQAGTKALGQYTNALADPFQNREFRFNMKMDPGYQFRMGEGQRAVESSAASRHGLGSGAAMKALNRYGQNFASNEFANAFNRQYGMFNDRFNRDYGMYNDRLNRLGQLAASGQNAAGMQASASQNYGGQLGANTMQGGQAAAQGFANAGNANAAGTVGMANAFTGGINNALGAWQYQNMMNAFQPTTQGGAPTSSPRPMTNPFLPRA